MTGFSINVFGQSDSLLIPFTVHLKPSKVDTQQFNNTVSDSGNYYQASNPLSEHKISDDSVVLLRNQLISHFRKDEIEEVRKVKDLLFQNQEREGEFLSFPEYWLILYWTKEYYSLLVSIENWKSDQKIQSRFHSIFLQLKIKSVEFHDTLNTEIEIATNGNDSELLKATLNLLLFTIAVDESKAFSIDTANKNNFEENRWRSSGVKNKLSYDYNPENPKQMIRLQALLLPGLFYEKLLFRNVTIQPGIVLGRFSYKPVSSEETETLLMCKLTLEARLYFDDFFWDQQDDWCQFFAGKFEQEIPLKNHEPFQSYTIYCGGTGSIYKRVYGLIGIGVGLVATPDGSYASINIPLGIGIRLSNK